MSETKEIEEVKAAPVEPKKGKGKKQNKAKYDNPSTFRPGGSAPIIDIDSKSIPGREHQFFVSFDPIVAFADELANDATNQSANRAAAAYGPIAMRGSVRRMAYIGLAKKLGYAVDPDQRQRTHTAVGAISRETLKMPLNLKNFLEGYGAFQHAGSQFRLVSTPIMAFNALAHGIEEPGDPNIVQARAFNPDNIYVNRQDNEWKRNLLNTAIMLVAAEVRASTATVAIGGITMRVPEVRSGFQAFLNLPGLNLSPTGTRWAGIAALLEANVNNAAYPANPADVAALNALFVYVLDYTRTALADRISQYRHNHEYILADLLSHVYDIVDVVHMEATGKPWQILDTDGDTGTTPISLTEEDHAIGLAASNRSVVLMDQMGVRHYTDKSKTARMHALVFKDRKRSNLA